MHNFLKLNKISSIIYRVIPNISYNLDGFSSLYKNKTLVHYFENIRNFSIDTDLYKFLKHRGFDMSLADEIANQIKNTKQIFLANVQAFPKLCNAKSKYKGLCGINQEDLDFVYSKLLITIFPGQINLATIPFIEPTVDEVVDKVNKTASFGLPTPFIKKRDAIEEIRAFLVAFKQRKLKISDLFHYPAAIFLRLQIRMSGMKTRIVHAVHALQQSLESFYYLYFISALPKGSALALGLTQIEVSSLCEQFRDYYTIPLDHKSWDLLKQPVLSVISFEILLNVLPLNHYQKQILTGLRNLFITLPSFHPTIELSRRYIGTVSGSGFTSLDNSISNWVFLNIVLFRYCKAKGLNPYTFEFKFYVLGDDILFGSKSEIDLELFFNIASSMFGKQLKLEGQVYPPGVNKSFFLGSSWIDGKPYRPEKLTVASIVLSTPSKLPPMSMHEKLLSRFIEIAGNSADCGLLFKRLGISMLPRLYFFRSLSAPFKMGILEETDRIKEYKRMGINTTKYSAGFWYDVNYSISALNHLWKSR